MGIVTAALIIGSSIVMSIDTGPKFIGFVGYLIAFANSLWIIWSVWRSGSTKLPASEADRLKKQARNFVAAPATRY